MYGAKSSAVQFSMSASVVIPETLQRIPSILATSRIRVNHGSTSRSLILGFAMWSMTALSFGACSMMRGTCGRLGGRTRKS